MQLGASTDAVKDHERSPLRVICVDCAISTIRPLSGPSRTYQLNVANLQTGVIQGSEPEPRIMRYELTDLEWTAIRPFLPNKPRGVPRVNDRRVLNGIFWILRSGAPWRDLPGSFGPYTTCCPFHRPRDGRGSAVAKLVKSEQYYRRMQAADRTSV
jgi:transposase